MIQVNNNDFLIPANANRGKLIMGLFRQIDLIIFGSGIVLTFILVLVFQNQMTRIEVAVAALMPVLVTGFLVIPVPNQHNILVFLTNVYNFYFVNRQRYFWKGWCFEHGKEDAENKQ